MDHLPHLKSPKEWRPETIQRVGMEKSIGIGSDRVKNSGITPRRLERLPDATTYAIGPEQVDDEH
ncbi:hypothetical protein JMJ77_0013149 [Colletotrichum scovillei]|uniref:Uncharacterized protein n=1 Tax=Colletotrichum scovillei TaxID=1209932 RepID=A0A9P7R8E7_9PEZI|nr:hypothetical protein JMJ77_0013149 [Colletotrichum scovillei]KAG7069440.1 hypothetical protein JMJ76_0003111 [Colletotrichum scovillei]KAG7073357.1 hypothetical protein JMJ78_0014335 [Colletotrichum scovillei]